MSGSGFEFTSGDLYQRSSVLLRASQDVDGAAKSFDTTLPITAFGRFGEVFASIGSVLLQNAQDRGANASTALNSLGMRVSETARDLAATEDAAAATQGANLDQVLGGDGS